MSKRPAKEEKLAEVVHSLDKRGCLVMLSNSDTDLMRDLYSEFNIQTVQAPRAINCKAQGRGRISELVITNY